jgi:endonuclease/exonuclease/phosphatase family metal-dependent hydrolase
MKIKKSPFLFLYGLQIMTFNTGLAPSYVPFSTERVPAIAAALNKQEAEVLCLQEVWLKKDQDLIKEQLKSSYPYSFVYNSSPVKTPTSPSCNFGNLVGKGKFVNCIANNCFSKESDGLTSCVLNKCTQALETLKNENKYCGQALMAQSKNPPLVAFWNILNPLKPADLFTYEGANGVMILSRHPILKQDIIDLTESSTLNRRAVLTVDVQPKSFKQPISIYCTHLTANFETSIPYSGKFRSWQEENKEQIKEIIAKIKTNPNPSILMGDFNCSTANKNAGIANDWHENCELLASALKEIHLQKPKCSFCKDNVLTNGEPRNLLLDHIYVNGEIAFEPAYLSLNQTYTITTEAKRTEQTPLSDHYAVESFITHVKRSMQSKFIRRSETKKNKDLF